MELGVFIPIGNNGWLISTTSPQRKPSFDLNRKVVQKAERFIADETDAAAIAKWEHYKAGTDMEALAWRDAQAEDDPSKDPYAQRNRRRTPRHRGSADQSGGSLSASTPRLRACSTKWPRCLGCAA